MGGYGLPHNIQCVARVPKVPALPPQGRGSWMTFLISQLTPSFSTRPPRNEICWERWALSLVSAYLPAVSP